MGLRKRIIGAIVLVGLAVIFLPMLLGHRATTSISIGELTTRPAHPDVKFAQESDFQSASPKVQAMQSPTTAVSTTTVMPSAPTAPTVDTKPLATGWMIQLGSFSNQTNAAQLVKQLQAQQYPAFQQTLQRDGNTLYRVMVGPETNQQTAATMLKAINSKFELQGKVTPYQPLQQYGGNT
tara:strand:+ start:126418 stop:126957 length:540 start_codon:yes stop_codon:yes gene_type:complete